MSNEHNNAPAVPQGEPVAWLDLSKMSASAMVYATGWKSNDKQSPLYTAAATAPAVPQGEPLTIQEQQKEWADYFNRCDSYDLPDRRHAFLAGLSRGRKIAAAPATKPAQEVGLTDEDVFEVAEPFGAFQYGDAQGDKRLDFARAIISALRAKGAGNA